jgi:hypothetical protein
MTRKPFAARGALLAIAAGVLASCGSVRSAFSDEENEGPCPNAFALFDAARVVEFRDPGVEDYSNVTYTAEIQAVRSLCRYYNERPIDSDLELEIGFGRGPAATDADHTYNLWVAVTRTDVAVLDRATIPIRVNFPRGQDRVYLRREIENIIIPRAEESTSGSNFEILVGFEVTPEQLEFNRLGKRFTLDAVQ